MSKRSELEAKIAKLEKLRDSEQVIADSLKIVINSSFGKFGNRFSALFSPKLLMQTTVTGQLALLMLIEAMEDKGLEVVSANTDGIIVHLKSEDDMLLFKKVWLDWEIQTGFNLEDTEYTSIHNESVNTYFAITPEGNFKTKGVYAPPDLSRTPTGDICCEAVMQFCANGIPVEDTIENCTDIKEFLYLRKVGGGAMYRDEKVGATCRWYTCLPNSGGGNLTYFKTGNSVPNAHSVMLCNKLTSYDIPDNLDKEAYIERAKNMIEAIGMSRPA